MFKNIIEDQRKRLEEEKRSLEIKINEIDEKIKGLEEQRSGLAKQFNGMGLSKETRNWYIEALDARIESDKSELEQQKNSFKTTKFEEEFKVTLKNELHSKIISIETALEEKKKEEDILREKILEILSGGDLKLIPELNKEMEKVLSTKDELSKILANLKDIENSFDSNTYEEVVAKMEKIEEISLITDTDVVEATPAATENKAEDVVTPAATENKALDVVTPVPIKNISEVNEEENIDNIDDKDEIEKIISELQTNISNFSEQEYVDNARKILSKIESLKDKDLQNDLKEKLKSIKFSSANNESNDNLNLDELKKKFEEKYSLLEREMLTDVAIDFDEIDSLANQIKNKTTDFFVITGISKSIDDLKSLYKFSGAVSYKMRNKEITSDDEKEISELLEKINKISPIVYDGMNKKFEEIKNNSKDPKGLKEDKFILFKRPVLKVNNVTLRNSKESTPEESLKKLKELEDKINGTVFDKLEDIKSEIKTATKSNEISASDELDLMELVNLRKEELAKIKATSEAIKENMKAIPLEKYIDEANVKGIMTNFDKYIDSIKGIYELIEKAPADSIVAKKYDELIDTFVKFNNRVSTKYNIEKYRKNPTSKKFDYLYNSGTIISKLSKESLKEEGLKKLFANTKKILKAKNEIASLQYKVRTEGMDWLSNSEKRKYNTASKDIAEDLVEILVSEIAKLRKNEFSLKPSVAFDTWILLLSIMPENVKVNGDPYTMGRVIQLVSEYIRLVPNVIKDTNDKSVKKQLDEKDALDPAACYSTVAGICLFRKENEHFDFIDYGKDSDDEVLYADSVTVLYGIRYKDPEAKVKDYINEFGTTYHYGKFNN